MDEPVCVCVCVLVYACVCVCVCVVCVFSLLIYRHSVDWSTQEEEGGWGQGIVFEQRPD